MQRLLKRRFVPYYFDMFPGGFASDAKARALIGKLRPGLKRAIGVHPIFFVSPAGEILGETTALATSKQLLVTMHRTLKQHSGYAQIGKAEHAAQSDLERAELQIDLQNSDGALVLLAKSNAPRARYLEGHVARLRRDWKRMKEPFSRLKPELIADDVSMESAHTLFFNTEFERLRKQFEALPAESRRSTEAQYYLGLAMYHLGHKREARALWKRRIESTAQPDRWIYRMDWAYSGRK